MKKTLSVILLLLVAVTCVFAGCGSPSGTKNSSGFSKFEKLYEAVIAEDYEAPTKLTIATTLEKSGKVSQEAVYNYDNEANFAGAEITYHHSDGKQYVNKLYNLVTEIEGKESVVAATMERFNAEKNYARTGLYKSFKVLHEGDDCETVFADYDLDANQYIADLYKAIIDAKEEKTATVKVTAGEGENDFTIEAITEDEKTSCTITIVNGLVAEYTHTYPISIRASYTMKKVFTWGSASVELPKNIETWMDCVYDFGDDYFYLHSCEEEGCLNSARQESLNTYADVFVYSLDEAKVAEIDAHYEAMEAHLASVEAYDETKHGFVKDSALYVANKAFERDFYDVYGDYLEFVTGQYQVAYILYCVNASEENTANNTFVDEYRTAMIADYYRLYKLIYDTQYREYFFSEEDGWTEEDIQIALEYSNQYADETIEQIQNRITEIETEYRALSNTSGQVVVDLYNEFVSLKNQYAQIKGYDNYMEYAYKNEHDRAYTPDETNTMRSFVKKYFSAAASTMLESYRKAAAAEATGKDKEYLNALNSASMFGSDIATTAIGDYFKTLKSSAHGQEIDYYEKANELFKNGNYFKGTSHEGAYGWYVDYAKTGILYFGPGYNGAFTFVHEFGHYYNYCYNPAISISTDVAEIHSQGNEMLFLSFLKNWIPKSGNGLYDALVYSNMYSAFANTLISTCVDEFEYIVYSGKYSDGTPYDSNIKSYDELFTEIAATYGLAELGVNDYWRLVCIESPCYYIAYAMSMIPSLELYVTAENEGLEAAKEKYFKLYAFTESEELTASYEDGSVYVTAGFADILEYAGLSSTFEEDVYKKIASAFKLKAVVDKEE